MFEIQSDEALHAQLQELFMAGHSEVVVQHPIDGSRVVTREQFDDWTGQNMTDAELNESRLAFCELVEGAEVREIAPDDPPGVDVHGKSIEIEGMTLVHSHEYPEQIEMLQGELGVLIDEYGDKSPSRLVYSSTSIN